MFRSVITHVKRMEPGVLNQDHTLPMVIEEIFHVTAITAVKELEVSPIDASVTAMIIVRYLINFHVGALDH